MSKETYNIFIYLVVHLFEGAKSFNLINYQRVFLFVSCGLNTLSQVVHGTQMLFPCIIN